MKMIKRYDIKSVQVFEMSKKENMMACFHDR